MALLFLVLEIIWLAILSFILYLLLRPIVNGAVYFPSSEKSTDSALKLMDIKPGQKIVDLGSGDGRMLVLFAQRGANVTGLEINPILVWRSRRLIKKAGLENRASVKWVSLWRTDLSGFDTVYLFGITFIMEKLGKKLKRELKPGTKIVSNIFEFPHWKPELSEERVYLYLA